MIWLCQHSHDLYAAEVDEETTWQRSKSCLKDRWFLLCKITSAVQTTTWISALAFVGWRSWQMKFGSSWWNRVRSSGFSLVDTSDGESFFSSSASWSITVSTYSISNHTPNWFVTFLILVQAWSPLWTGDSFPLFDTHPKSWRRQILNKTPFVLFGSLVREYFVTCERDTKPILWCAQAPSLSPKLSK